MFRPLSRWALAGVVGLIVLSLAGSAAAQEAAGADGQAVPRLPGVQPATGTPAFPAATHAVEQVRQLVQCGKTMYAVGTFSVVTQGGHTFTRHNAFSFSSTGPFTLTSWNPGVNGVVNSIAFNSGRCADAYIGGSFTAVGGKKAVNLAEVSTSGTGALVSGFRHFANKPVETLASYQNHVLAGGFFTSINGSTADPYMTSLNAATGVNDGLLALRISGRITYPGVSGNNTKVFNQQISHSGKLDLVEGDFATVGGRRRQQIVMLNLASRPTATVTGWTSPRWDGSRGYPPHGYYYNCLDREPFYIRAAAWSPDDSTIYLASTGLRPWNYQNGFPLKGLCDAAAAFTASQTAPTLKWINYTGCDSLYSVAADVSGAYFGGHQRYSQNPDGCNTPGPGAIADPGLEGLSPSTGAVLLNSSSTALYSRGRGLGADDLLITSAGLWIASDNYAGTDTCDTVANHSGICFLPYGP